MRRNPRGEKESIPWKTDIFFLPEKEDEIFFAEDTLHPGPVDLDKTITKQPPKVEDVVAEAVVNRRLSLNPLVEEPVQLKKLFYLN